MAVSSLYLFVFSGILMVVGTLNACLQRDFHARILSLSILFQVPALIFAATPLKGSPALNQTIAVLGILMGFVIMGVAWIHVPEEDSGDTGSQQPGGNP